LDYTLRYEYVSANTIETQLGLITGVEGTPTIRSVTSLTFSTA